MENKYQGFKWSNHHWTLFNGIYLHRWRVPTHLSGSDACNPFPEPIYAFPPCWQKDGRAQALGRKAEGKHHHSRVSWSVDCAGFVPDLSCWKIMEGLIFCVRCVCVWDARDHWDVTHASNLKASLLSIHGISHHACVEDRWGELSVPDRSVTSIFSLRFGFKSKNTLYFWVTAEREKKNKSTCMKITTTLIEKTLHLYLHHVEPSTTATAVLIDTLLIVTHSFKITIFHSCSVLHWWQIYGN